MVASSSYSYKLLEGRQTSGGIERYADDLAAVAGSPGLRGVVLPQADDPATIATTVAASPAGVSVLPLVESGAKGVTSHGSTRWMRGSVRQAISTAKGKRC
jgi:citrate lyase subunit beta / citryl-CoA lyase